MNWKRVWDGVKEGIIKSLPAAIAALIGFAIAKVNQTTRKLETQKAAAPPTVPPKRRSRKARRSRR